MKKIFLLTITVVLMIIAGCSNKKDQNKILNQKSIEKVAMIAAMLEIDNDKAIEMLGEEDISTEYYKEMIYKISLDEKATETFIKIKKSYKEQYQE